jgi:predicted nucleic-acid-binding protein
MIGLDTNALVRYLAQDDAVQSRQATQIIERQLTEERPDFMPKPGS